MIFRTGISYNLRVFRFQVARAPKVTFFGNSVNIPGITLRTTTQTTPGLKDIDLPGEIIDFEDLTLRFLVDEDLQNYQEIQNWIRGLGFPESLQEIYDLQDQKVGSARDGNTKTMNIYSDGTLTILDAMQHENFKVKFQDLFPIPCQQYNLMLRFLIQSTLLQKSHSSI